MNVLLGIKPRQIRKKEELGQSGINIKKVKNQLHFTA